MPSKAVINQIESSIDDIFDGLKTRFLGVKNDGKRLIISANNSLSLPGIFEMAAQDEGGIPNQETLSSLVTVASNYIESTRANAKAQILNVIQSASSLSTDNDFKNQIKEQLSQILIKVSADLERILETETQKAKNFGLLDGVIKTNSFLNVSDPVVFWIVTWAAEDDRPCEECKKLHLMPDLRTPRLWYLSEVSQTYHKMGTDSVSIMGPHPRCLCLYDGNAPVITERGSIPLKKVVIGDRVLTHEGKFKKVLSTFGYDGMTPASDDILLRIEFLSPQGKKHKLRVTKDHLMMTQRGWVAAGELNTTDSLKFLFKECEFCKTPFPHNINKNKKRFCSAKCSDASRVRRVSLNSLNGYSFRNVPITNIVTVPKTKMSKASRLYDITVEEDSSFVVMGVISHNCTLTTLLPGMGFNSSGRVTYISEGYDAIKDQRS